MKNYLFALLILSAKLIQSCAKDSNGNVTEVVPIPPVDLTANVTSTTQVDLSWTDKSTNESGFKIQRKSGSQTFADIATTGKDVTIFSDKGLTAGTTYTYRIYSFNNTGASPTYSNELIVTTNLQDIEGNIYKAVQIGNQTWMAENLRTKKYKNDIAIPDFNSSEKWASIWNNFNTTKAPAWCYINFNENYNIPYGKLYNWHAVSNTNGICPAGWHVPTDNEWTILTNYLGGVDSAAKKMKSFGTEYWFSPNNGATNSSGFSALPGSWMSYSGQTAVPVGESGLWWSSTLKTGTDKFAWIRALYYDDSGIDKYADGSVENGLSVRCIKD
jgi:uncharacterized protein (TIGR02145 family)